MNERHFYVYIMANEGKTLYTGVTNNVAARVAQHKSGTGSTFTSRYALTKLVYVEETNNVHDAITREKQLKGWVRYKKVALIEAVNPEWDDLSVAWSGEADPSLRSG